MDAGEIEADPGDAPISTATLPKLIRGCGSREKGAQIRGRKRAGAVDNLCRAGEKFLSIDAVLAALLDRTSTTGRQAPGPSRSMSDPICKVHLWT
jgi:hypothetical protein